jgi:hypothetical protein
LKDTGKVVDAIHAKTFDVDPECPRSHLGLSHGIAARG